MEVKICNSKNYYKVCPLYDAHDKLEESYHFLLLMAISYHDADEFRFNLHAFIQALREVTFMLQNYKSVIPNFEKWYIEKQEEMKSNLCLKKFSEARTIVVHKKSLKAKSKIDAGLFRGRNLKLTFTFSNLHPFLDTKDIFKIIVPKIYDIGFIDESHSSIGEQIGIRREWYCDELGDNEIFATCYEAYSYICKLMIEAHSLLNLRLIPHNLPKSFIENIYVVLESDLDPSLLKKWGW